MEKSKKLAKWLIALLILSNGLLIFITHLLANISSGAERVLPVEVISLIGLAILLLWFFFYGSIRNSFDRNTRISRAAVLGCVAYALKILQNILFMAFYPMFEKLKDLTDPIEQIAQFHKYHLITLGLAAVKVVAVVLLAIALIMLFTQMKKRSQVRIATLVLAVSEVAQQTINLFWMNKGINDVSGIVDLAAGMWFLFAFILTKDIFPQPEIQEPAETEQ